MARRSVERVWPYHNLFKIEKYGNINKKSTGANANPRRNVGTIFAQEKYEK